MNTLYMATLFIVLTFSNMDLNSVENTPLPQQPNKSLINLMQEERVFQPKKTIQENAYVSSMDEYDALYRRSIEDSDNFWLEQASTLDWFTPPTVACQYTWNSASGNFNHTWFEDGTLNVSYNCLDRHLNTPIENKIAILWQGDQPDDVRKITYEELYSHVCRFSNVLQNLGVTKGDRVCFYLPTIPEAAVAMLACARIGAIHSVVFAGFSAESLMHRIHDAECQFLITSNVGIRGGKILPLKRIVDEALTHCPSIKKVIVVQRTQDPCHMVEGRDVWYHQEMENADAFHFAPPLNAEDPLFILYTSGSTGKPKGVVHTQAGYLLHASLSHKYIFNIHDDDIYWCTADIGWITGHSYCVYGPLANGAITLLFEGTPVYPHPDRFWEVVEKFGVTVLYTAPTAIRTLIASGDEWTKKHDLSSLRVLGSVGEPINPEAWMWYYQEIGQESCPIVDTWWQTETGGIMITPMPGSHPLKPGSATRPFFGVEPIILKSDGTPCGVNEGGALCIKRPWPGIMRTTWGDHKRFIEAYFSTYKDVYFTGDGCRIDADGDYWLLGRIDDVVNVSGHRISTAEVESALVSHPDVAEAAVVPIPHEIKGQGLMAYVILVADATPSPELNHRLAEHVRNEIGAIAKPDKIQFCKALPKTRSGKIMRRLLRKIAAQEFDTLGDTTTLADPSVLKDLMDDG